MTETTTLNLFETDEERAAKLRAAREFFGRSRRKTWKVDPAGPRPRCVRCGAPYGERAIEVEIEHFAVGQPVTPYVGAKALLAEVVSPGWGYAPDGGPGAVVSREVWDRVSYRAPWRSDPFCSLKCAHTFACFALAAGYRPET